MSKDIVLPWFCCLFRRTFRIWVLRNVCGHCPPDYLWTPPTTQEDLANDRPHLDCHSSFYFDFDFLGPSLLMHIRHVVLFLDLLMMSPVKAMLKTNWCHCWMTHLERPEVRNCPFCIYFLPLFGQPRLLAADPRIGICDRTVGVSSNDCTVTKRPRSWTYICASSCVCTYPLDVTTTVGVLDFRRVSISSELKSLFFSMCIEALESITNSFSSGNFEVGKRGLVRIFKLVSFFRQVPCCFAGAPFLL